MSLELGVWSREKRNFPIKTLWAPDSHSRLKVVPLRKIFKI